jgi:hypothetical protein
MNADNYLKKLYFEDINNRTSLSRDKKLFVEYDALFTKKLQILKTLFSKINLDNALHCHYVAYLFHHGDTTEDYQLANEYAKRAIQLGSKESGWIYAASLDRFLISQGKKQHFGTQFKVTNGTWRRYPTNKTTSDEERLNYNVPPLKSIRQKFLIKNSIKGHERTK